MTIPLLQLDNISKRYCRDPKYRFRYAVRDAFRETCGRAPLDRLRTGEFWALRDIDLQIAPGEVVGLIGHNGAGKSTLINLIAGVILPTTGRIRASTNTICRIDQSGMISQKQTGRENIELQLAYYDVSAERCADEIKAIAEFADLTADLDSTVGTYSSGMRSRLGFAIFSRLRPDLFLVDEAIGGGDRRFRDRFRHFLDDYVAAGGAMLFSMHDTHTIQSLCHRVVLLDEGRAVLTADPATAIDAYNALATRKGHPPLAPGGRHGRKATSPSDAPQTFSMDDAIVAIDTSVNGVGGQAIAPGGPVDVRVRLTSTEKFEKVACVITIGRGDLTHLATIRGPVSDVPIGTMEFCCRIDFLAFEPGTYDLLVTLFLPRNRSRPKRGLARDVSQFIVSSPGSSGMREESRQAIVHLAASWAVSHASTEAGEGDG